jgi:hypothetical protein
VGDAIRSEWIKLRTTRSSMVLWAIALAVPVLLGVLVAVSIPVDSLRTDDTVANRFALVVSGLATSHVLLAVLGALAIGTEFRHGTIRVTFAADPLRRRVFGAKAVVVFAVGLVTGVVGSLSAFFVGAAILGGRGHGVSLSDPGVTRALAGSIAVAALYSLIGLGIGTIVRATAASISILVIWPVLIEALIVGFLPSVGKFFPFQTAAALSSPNGADRVLGPVPGGLLFVLFVAIALVVGDVLLERRDA